MVRVQVQLRAQNERTKLIIQEIERSKKIELVVKMVLVCFLISYFIYYIIPFITYDPDYYRQLINYSFVVFQLLFIVIFSWQMLQVNLHFRNFFRQLNDQKYPYMLIKLALIGYFLVTVLNNAMRVIQNNMGLHIIYWLLFRQIHIVYEQFIYFA